jgi:hypothetical protein
LPAAGAEPVEKKKPPPGVAPRPEPRARPVATLDGTRPATARRVVSDVEEPLPDYVGTPEAESYVAEDEPAVPVAAVSERNAIVRRPVTAEERERILNDPLVQQTIELFAGAVVNIEREVAARPTEAAEQAEPTE